MPTTTASSPSSPYQHPADAAVVALALRHLDQSGGLDRMPPAARRQVEALTSDIAQDASAVELAAAIDSLGTDVEVMFSPILIVTVAGDVVTNTRWELGEACTGEWNPILDEHDSGTTAALAASSWFDGRSNMLRQATEAPAVSRQMWSIVATMYHPSWDQADGQDDDDRGGRAEVPLFFVLASTQHEAILSANKLLCDLSGQDDGHLTVELQVDPLMIPIDLDGFLEQEARHLAAALGVIEAGLQVTSTFSEGPVSNAYEIGRTIGNGVAGALGRERAALDAIHEAMPPDTAGLAERLRRDFTAAPADDTTAVVHAVADALDAVAGVLAAAGRPLG